MSSVQEASGKTSYTYHANGRVEQTTLPNGSITLNSYDSNARLIQIVSKKADGSVIHGVRYTLADNGQRIAVAEFDSLSTLDNGILNNPARSSSFQYDSLGRLTQELLKNRAGSIARTTDYTYDKVGNRQQKTDTTASGSEITTYTYDANDRLRQEEKTTSTGSAVQTIYTWDANGNLKSKAIGGVTTVYLWNIDNRLIEVKQGSSEASAQSFARYHYDAQGNRVSKTEAGQNGELDKVTQYLVDTNFPYAQTVQEIITQGNTRSENRYLWGHSLIQQTRAGQAVFYHADGLGSVKALSDAGGNVTDTYAYDAFGQIEGRSGTTSNAYRFTGEYFDDAINLQFNRARWYAAGMGRFVSQDNYVGAVARPITLNKYLYADNDPIIKRDASGRTSIGEVGSANSIAGTLNTIQINFSVDFASAALDPSGFGATSVGLGVLASLLPSGAKILLRGLHETKFGSGFVRFSLKNPRDGKEIGAAEFLAERIGARIFIRGANQGGADFLMNGVKYELYSPTSMSKSVVSRSIRDKAVRQGAGRLVLDARSCGLSDFQIFEAIEHAVINGASIIEVIIINKTGRILYWM